MTIKIAKRASSDHLNIRETALNIRSITDHNTNELQNVSIININIKIVSNQPHSPQNKKSNESNDLNLRKCSEDLIDVLNPIQSIANIN